MDLLVLGGGGFKGLAQLGYLSVAYRKPSRVIGISVGAINGLLLLLDYSPALVFKLASGLLRLGVLPLDLQYQPLSCVTDRVLRTVIGALLQHRGWSLETPYAQFRQVVPWDALVYCLTCRATLLVSAHVENWSDKESICIDPAEWTVWDVLRASLSYPVCFAPVHKQHTYVDGMTSVYSQFLLTQYLQRQSHALCLLLTNDCDLVPNVLDSTPMYLNALIRSQFVVWTDPEFVALRRTIWSRQDEEATVKVISCPVSAFDPTAVQLDVQCALWQRGVDAAIAAAAAATAVEAKKTDDADADADADATS